MRILYVSTEVVPFAKTGGLGDVAGALPPALAGLGHDPMVAMPLYRSVKEGDWPIRPTGKQISIPVGGRTVDGAIHLCKLPGTEIPVFFIACDEFFDRDGLYTYADGGPDDNIERFTFFSRAVLEMIRAFELRIDILHVNDWPTALIPAYAKTLYHDVETLRSTRTLLTIHNLGYQGIFPGEMFAATGLPLEMFRPDGMEFYGKVNLLKAGIVYADAVSTVSETYAKEIQAPEQGCGLDGLLRAKSEMLTGIANGIDTNEWNPATDRRLAANYSADNLSGKLACKRALQKRCGLLQIDVPLIGAVSRLTDQKGFDLFETILKGLMKHEFQFVLLGTGEEKYHELFADLKRRFPSRCWCYLGFDDPLAHQIEAAADLYLMPSRYEPCGLNQLYSLRYGAVPIVHRTGGLADTVTDCTPESLEAGLATGFVFDKHEPAELYSAILRAFDLYRDKPQWTRLMQTGMRRDSSWTRAAAKYVHLYEQLTAS